MYWNTWTLIWTNSVSSTLDHTIQSEVPHHPLLPAALMFVTVTTPLTIRRLAWHHQRAAGRPRAMATMANTTSTTWTLTQTRTPILHPLPPAPSTCQLRRAALRPLQLSAPTSTCAPLLPRPAPTLRDPPTAQEPCEEGMDEVHLLHELAMSGQR